MLMPGARSAPSRAPEVHLRRLDNETCRKPRMMAQISNRYFCRMDCSRGMGESCSCTLQMKTGASGGPSLPLAFVHKDSLWRRVLNSWFQIQDSRSKSSLSSTCKVPSIRPCVKITRPLSGTCLEPDDKITQVMARRIHWMGSRNETHLQEVLLTGKQKARCYADSIRGVVLWIWGGHRDVRRRCLLRRV